MESTTSSTLDAEAALAAREPLMCERTLNGVRVELAASIEVGDAVATSGGGGGGGKGKGLKLTLPGKGAVPCKNQVVDNSYCKAGKFIDATQAQTDGWDSTVKDNKEVPCKYQKEPPAFGHPRIE